MIRIVLGFFLLLISFSGFGQLSYSPEVLDIFGSPSEDLITFKIDLTNTSAEDLDFYWSLSKSESFPSEWQTQICDFNLCYAENVDLINTELPNTIKAGETRDIKIYLLPNRTQGESSLTLTLYSDKELSNEILVLASNSVMVTGSTAVSDKVKEKLIIYPNPTSDYFKISEDSEVGKVAIYNIAGKELKRFDHYPGQIHNVESLRKTLYLVRLFDDRGEIIKSLRLSKI